MTWVEWAVLALIAERVFVTVMVFWEKYTESSRNAEINRKIADLDAQIAANQAKLEKAREGMTREFYSTENAAKECGLSLRHFQRVSEQAGCKPVVILGKWGHEKFFWRRAHIDKIRNHRAGGGKP